MSSTIIVASDGSGDFSDIQSALSATKPGDTVYIREGAYDANQGLELDTPNVTVSGYPGDEFPKIAASSGSDGPHAVFSFGIDSSGSVLQNVDISGGREYAIKLETAIEYGHEYFGSAASNIIIQNNIIHDSGRDCIKLTPNCDNVSIFGNEIYGSGRGGTLDDFPSSNAEGIDAVNVDDLVVRGNYIHDIATTGAYVKGGSKNALFEDNLIENTGLSTAALPNSGGGIASGYTTDSEYYDTDNTEYAGTFNTTIRNNIIKNTLDSGVLLSGAKDPVVTQNTILDAGGVQANGTRWYLGGISIQPLTTYTGGSDTVVTETTNPVILGNIVSVSSSSLSDEAWSYNDPLIVSSSTDLSAANIDGNVYWDADGQVDFDGKSLSDHQEATGFDQSSEVLEVTSQIDSGGRPLDGSQLAESGAGAVPIPHYGAKLNHFLTATPDETPPKQPSILTSEEFANEYKEGVLVHWSSNDDVSYYNVYLDGNLVGYTTANGYFLRQRGTFELTIEAVDSAGNVSQLSPSFSVSFDPEIETPPRGGESPGEDPTNLPDEGDITEFEPVEGVEGLSGIHIGNEADGTGGQITLLFQGKTYFGYTDGSLKVIDRSTGEVVFSVNPETGDAQEGKSTFTFNLPEDLANGAYTLSIGHLFARIERPGGEWVNMEVLSPDVIDFDIANEVGEAPNKGPVEDPDEGPVEDPTNLPDDEGDITEFEPVEGVEGLSGIHIGNEADGAGGQITLLFQGKTYFGYTDGSLKVIDRSTGEVVFSVNPETGDAQEGKSTFTFNLPEDLANGAYTLSIGHLFARIERPGGEWVNMEVLSPDVIDFDIANEVGEAPNKGPVEDPDEGPVEDPTNLPDDEGDITEFEPVEGVEGLSGIHIGNEADGAVGQVTLLFEGKTYFGYTDGSLKVIGRSTGEVAFSVDPETGDTQEGKSTFTFNLPEDLANGAYTLSIGHLFARIERPDGEWVNMEGLSDDIYNFSISSSSLDPYSKIDPFDALPLADDGGASNSAQSLAASSDYDFL
ncbi:right-handed parallel beta-helix repeat-containing protein [Pseudovibrio sp. Alg231-02]|uniref:right-handed parallel beta-helix repeat-containing protein n=1 Tax=Pseudovibrio sp. Alg231-02 TaxID=1922223 RepID=UPI00131F0D0E|nr:right-handed parallel beta-helix repeat-containing protein [Pseudovibrio sp. Alg231-02]